MLESFVVTVVFIVHTMFSQRHVCVCCDEINITFFRRISCRLLALRHIYVFALMFNVFVHFVSVLGVYFLCNNIDSFAVIFAFIQ